MPVASEMHRTVSTAKIALFMFSVSFVRSVRDRACCGISSQSGVAVRLHRPLWQGRLYGGRCAGEVSPCTPPAHFLPGP